MLCVVQSKINCIFSIHGTFDLKAFGNKPLYNDIRLLQCQCHRQFIPDHRPITQGHRPKTCMPCMQRRSIMFSINNVYSWIVPGMKYTFQIFVFMKRDIGYHKTLEKHQWYTGNRVGMCMIVVNINCNFFSQLDRFNLSLERLKMF